jgi:hypothetical protein
VLTIAVATGAVPRPLGAQQDDDQKEQSRDHVWRIEGLETGFCVQLLLDPAKLQVKIPRDARPLRADAVEDLSPVLRNVISNQPESAGWTPSKICLYFMRTVDTGARRISERDLDDLPMVAVWSLTAADSAGAAREIVLRFFTNNGGLERAGRIDGLDLRRVRTEIRSIPNHYDPEAPPIGLQREVRLDKATLIWEGRHVDDSTRAERPVVFEWRGNSERRGPVTARLVLTPEWTRGMAGSLRVLGDEEFAEAVKASPIRFVGPALLGGSGELVFGRR